MLFLHFLFRLKLSMRYPHKTNFYFNCIFIILCGVYDIYFLKFNVLRTVSTYIFNGSLTVFNWCSSTYTFGGVNI